MRLGLAAKLSLLAALLVFGTTVVAGRIFYKGARAVVRGREASSLRDEAELSRRELLADLDRAPADLLALAGYPATHDALATQPVASRERLDDAAKAVLNSRPEFYLEVAVVTAADLAAVARFKQTSGGPQPVPAATPGTWPLPQDVALIRRSAATAVSFSDVRAGTTAPLEMVLVTPIAGRSGRTIGYGYLRLNFAALTARLNRSPRIIGFLVNRQGEYLAHPDPKCVLTGPGDTDLDKAFAELRERSQNATNLNEDERLDELTLPGLTVFAAAARLPTPPDLATLHKVRDKLLLKYPGLRIGRGTFSASRFAGTPRLSMRAGDEATLKQALLDLRSDLGQVGIPVEFDDPYRCETFLARAVPVRPEAPVACAPVPPDAPSARPWFGLAVAAAHEEIEHDITEDYRKNTWLSALVAAAAGAGMLIFAVYLTGPLRRMTAYAEKVAAGQDSDVELPDPRGRDEIGTLARAFRGMVEQVHGRTRELRESEARIRTILNTAAEGIVTIDEKGRLESFNQAAERIFGYPAAEVRGEHFRKLLYRGASDDMPTLLGSTSIAAGSLSPESSLMSISRVNNTTREVVGRRRNGATFPVEMSVSEVVLGDRLVYTAIMRDITDRKQAETQIQKMTEELEQRVRERTAELVQANQSLESARDLALEANRAKDAFLAVMSHELRTPLTAIIGYCDLWLTDLKDTDDHDPQEMLDDLRKIHISGRHLLTLINDILDLAKIQAGKMVLEATDFDLSPLLHDLQEWVDPLVRKNSNVLTVEAANDLGAMRADRTRVRQVLLNLLSNAAKFTNNGDIRLTAERVSGAGGRAEIVFRVTDTGVGMKPEDVRRLFQPFVQVDSSNTRKHEGTGLGLAICRKLCELMGGTIEVQSELGVGTTFTVSIPARMAPPELPGARRDGPAALPAASESATVLVVDDDPQTRALLQSVLAKEGYRVLTAAGGSAGLEAARTLRPAAVILDALAAGPGGWTILGALKAEAATANIPVIMATVVDGHTRGVALGATDYVAKPIDWARLGVILRTYRSEPGAPILLVEDDTSTREVTARTLRAQGWMVLEATDGREALDRVRELQPAAILLDLMMPNMDGFEFLAVLRQEPSWRTIPVIVVTAADLSEADRARLAGSVQQVLQKGSTTPGQLLAEVRERVKQGAEK
jgi:PAS domain S-box-containing protein